MDLGDRKGLSNWAWRALTLNYFVDSLLQIRRLLRTSPAMAAGTTVHLWKVADLVELWESEDLRMERGA